MAEILAPAGSIESVFAAVRNGADAVYLAGKDFNARRNAKSFSDEELEQAVKFCHSAGVKVHFALNTLIKDSERERFIGELKRILALGGDALILQDSGAVEIVKSICPDIPLHASTQLSVHTLEGVNALERLGFSRAVLARELSREEIDYIRKNTDMELEVFVHGALCMCVSGQCLLSSFLGARSGNRGLCAQPCRLPFKADGGTGHDLSLKDNSLIEYLPELEKMGINSFKIEGRMKRAEYVAASVSACKSALEGNLQISEITNLKNIFSRQGFTDGYYTSSLGKDMFGFRTKDDVLGANSELLKQYGASYSKNVQSVPCEINAKIKENEYPEISISALGKSAGFSGAKMPEKALNKALEKGEVTARLSKLGSTPYYAEKVTLDLGEGLALSAGEINALRRGAVEKLEEKLNERNYTVNEYKAENIPPKKHGEIKNYFRFGDISVIDSEIYEKADKIIVPLEKCEQAFEKFGADKLIPEAPRVMFGKEKEVERLIIKAGELGINQIAAGNIGTLEILKKQGIKEFAFLGSNVFNSISARSIEAQEILLSPELSFADIKNIRTTKNTGIIVYGHLPMMITRNCPIKNGKTCKECSGKSHLTDRKGEKFEVRCRFASSEIFNPYALYVCDKNIENIDFKLFYFTYENKTEIKHVLSLAEARQKPDFKFTSGLYSKGVL